MPCPRRESNHSDGITDQKSLQRTSATKSAKSRHSALRYRLALFDHLVGATEQQRWHVEVQRFGGLEIDDQFKLCRRLDREVGRLLALEDAVDVLWHLAKLFDIIRTVGHQAA